MDYTKTRADLLTTGKETLDMVRRGVVDIHVGQTFPLEFAMEAHRVLAARETRGSTVLLP